MQFTTQASAGVQTAEAFRTFQLRERRPWTDGARDTSQSTTRTAPLAALVVVAA